MSLVGHNKLQQQLLDLVKKGSLPQTLLFYGKEGIGKKTFSLALVQGLFCSSAEKNAFEACGTCSSCVALSNDQHPDFFLIEPTGPKSASKTGAVVNASQKSIKVEQVQEIKSKLIHHPLMASHQIVLIDNADQLTVTAANSLLKMIEEPRSQQIFILVSGRLHKVLPTLRSRSAKYFFESLTPAQVSQVIQNTQSDLSSEQQEQIPGWAETFDGSVSAVLQALQASFSLEQVMGWLKPAPSFKDAQTRVSRLLESQLDLSLFLQALRSELLKQQKRDQSVDLNFFDALDAAERQLGRHLSKEQVLENLCLEQM
ncbi:MAG: AAA family ATPase [Deltaproteobacteria bacterium]|nr:AAA family ATPase [Deltaproteobacteria bacterium]